MSKEQEVNQEVDNKDVKATESGAKSTTKTTKEAKSEDKPAEKKAPAKKAPAKKAPAKKAAVKKAPAKKAAPKKSEPKAKVAPVVEEAPTVVEEAAPVAEEAPAVVEEAPAVVEEAKSDTVKTVSAIEDRGDNADEAVEQVIVVEAPFDWAAHESGVTTKSSDHESMEKMYADTLMETLENQMIEGLVMKMTDRDVIIDIGSKSEGIISLNEFRYNPDLKVGDKVEVYVDKQEDKLGQLVLSHRKARSIKAWDRVNEAFAAEEIVNGLVKCRTKGGMIVDIFGLEAFLPGSQIDVKAIRDYDVYVGKAMEFKIVKINHEFKNVVVSHKALIEADLEDQKREIIGQLEKGQVLEGIVKNITSYGVFVDLGGVDGLVHITDLSWSRVGHPSEIVELDAKINVVILDFDEAKTRIQLGVKQLSAHPWDALSAEMKEGDKIKGKVIVLADYGAFVEVAPGVEGLVHVSEMSWGSHLRSAQDFFKVGDMIDAVILGIDREDRKMSLGVKQLTPDPWSLIVEKFPTGSLHKGKVRNFTNFGVFLELEEGIDGLVHISDLSWTKKIKHPSEFTTVGAEIEIKVLDIDLENRRLSLGHKQAQVNPWDNYENEFPAGSIHEGMVTEAVEKGYVVIFEEAGLEAYCPPRHASKEVGGNIVVGEKLPFRIIEVNRDARRVVVSHTQTHTEMKVESGEGSPGNKSAGKGRSTKQVNQAIEKTTLGDLGTLAKLKKEMEKKG